MADGSIISQTVMPKDHREIIVSIHLHWANDLRLF